MIKSGGLHLTQEIYLDNLINSSAADMPEKAADSTLEEINASPAIVSCMFA